MISCGRRYKRRILALMTQYWRAWSSRRMVEHLMFFRGRIVIGLHNPQGQLIGFTGRVLDDSQPKYLNTSKTLAYDKSRHVFGWHLAQAEIRKADLAILAEGNMDVVASHQAGVKKRCCYCRNSNHY
jgi:DNA primase